jgi:hypothetical protein
MTGPCRPEQPDPVYGILTGGNSPSSETYGFMVDCDSDVHFVKSLKKSALTKDRVLIVGNKNTRTPEPIMDRKVKVKVPEPLYVKDGEFGQEEFTLNPRKTEQPQTKEHLTPKILTDRPNLDGLGIPFDNVLDIDSSYLEQIVKKSKAITGDLVDLLLLNYAPLSFSGDSANAHLEAVMRDCFGVEIETDDNLAVYIDAVTKTDLISFILKKQKNIPRKIRNFMLKKFVSEIAESSGREINQHRKSASFKKYRTELDNAQARTQNPNIGLSKRRKS